MGTIAILFAVASTCTLFARSGGFLNRPVINKIRTGKGQPKSDPRPHYKKTKPNTKQNSSGGRKGKG